MREPDFLLITSLSRDRDVHMVSLSLIRLGPSTDLRLGLRDIDVTHLRPILDHDLQLSPYSFWMHLEERTTMGLNGVGD